MTLGEYRARGSLSTINTKKDMPCNVSEVDLAYAAGIIDGEGCIRIQKTKTVLIRDKRRSIEYVSRPKYQLVVIVAMQDSGACRFLHNIFGGSFSFNNARRMFVWAASTNRAHAVLSLIRPHLKVKGDQADIGIKFREDFKKCSTWHCIDSPENEDEHNRREWCAAELARLKHVKEFETCQ